MNVYIVGIVHDKKRLNREVIALNYLHAVDLVLSELKFIARIVDVRLGEHTAVRCFDFETGKFVWVVKSDVLF